MKRLLASTFLGVAMLTSGCSALMPNAANNNASSKSAKPDSAEEKDTEELAKYAHAFAVSIKMINRRAAEPVSYEKLLTSAFDGMLSGIDPHSEYQNAEELENTFSSINGSYGGIGITYETKGKELVILSVTKNQPAGKAGLVAGDRIIRVDGKLAGDVSGAMKGEPDTTVSLEVVKAAGGKTVTVEVKRVEMVVDTVTYSRLPDNIGYIRIKSFNAHTGEQVEEAIKALRSDPANDVKAFVLDLRGNLGGSVDGAVETADAFLDKGLITFTRGQKDNDRWEATAGDLTDGKPLAVLVDAHSASASEIVAGALQDNGRAEVYGTQTYGKGLVQTTLKFSDFGLKTRKDGVVLTTAYYYTPSGKSIQIKGLTPDVLADDIDEAGGKKKNREVDLGNAPANPRKDATVSTPKQKCDLAVPADKLKNLNKAFVRVSDGKPDTPLLCAVEGVTYKMTYTLRKAYIAK